MGSPCQSRSLYCTVFLTVAVAMMNMGCAGGDGVREPGSAVPSPGPAEQRASETSTTSDIDRVLAENPGNPHSNELKQLRNDVAEDENQKSRRVTSEPVDRYEPHDRRVELRSVSNRDDFKLEGAVDSHDRFADEKAAKARHELTWQPMRVDQTVRQ